MTKNQCMTSFSLLPLSMRKKIVQRKITDIYHFARSQTCEVLTVVIRSSQTTENNWKQQTTIYSAEHFHLSDVNDGTTGAHWRLKLNGLDRVKLRATRCREPSFFLTLLTSVRCQTVVKRRMFILNSHSISDVTRRVTRIVVCRLEWTLNDELNSRSLSERTAREHSAQTDTFLKTSPELVQRFGCGATTMTSVSHAICGE